MAERSFKKEVQDLRAGEGEIFRGEGILAITKALLQSGVSYVGGYQGSPISHLMDVLADANDLLDSELPEGDFDTVSGLVLAELGRMGATGDVVFLGRVDGELENDRAARSEVARWIRTLQPDVLAGHDPWQRYRLHPDHRNAGWLASDGIVAARDPKFFPEQNLPHHRPDSLLLWEADEPDHVEDVTGHFDAKYAALLAHESQFESTMKAKDSDELGAFRARVEGKLTTAGEAGGVAMAEVFKLIDDL